MKDQDQKQDSHGDINGVSINGVRAFDFAKKTIKDEIKCSDPIDTIDSEL